VIAIDQNDKVPLAVGSKKMMVERLEMLLLCAPCAMVLSPTLYS